MANSICTIYALTNTINNKIYIGQTWMELEARMRGGANYSNSPYIFNAINKYGVENFSYIPLSYCKNQESADTLEAYFMDFYDTRNPEIGYNIKEGGRGGRHSEESKSKISATLKEKADLWTPEERANRAAPISGYWTGKERGPQSEEKKEANSIFFKDWHANNEHPMLGKHHTKEAKKKISEASKNIVHSKESIEAGAIKRRNTSKDAEIIEAYSRGDTISSITDSLNIKTSLLYRVLRRNNISRERSKDTWTGKTHSEETKSKMANSRKEYWESKKQ